MTTPTIHQSPAVGRVPAPAAGPDVQIVDLGDLDPAPDGPAGICLWHGDEIPVSQCPECCAGLAQACAATVTGRAR